jgi:DNA-binding transcriptional LysR family regulator
MDWEDLRYFSEVARTGSLAGAARALGVNHSTVFRRINRLEEDLGVKLFERHREGYVLSVAGEDMRPSVADIADSIEDMDRRLAGRDLRLTGTLTVTTTDTLVLNFLGAHFAAFRQRYPDVTVEVVLASEFLNLSKRQADVAIRPTLAPPDVLVGRRLATITFAVYGAGVYLKRAGRKRPLESHEWLGFDSGLAHLAEARWMRERQLGIESRFRANNLLALLGAARAGMGLAVLPCFLADDVGELECLEVLPEGAGSALWMLTHADLRNTARVRAFMDCVGASIQAERHVLEGRQRTPRRRSSASSAAVSE